MYAQIRTHRPNNDSQGNFNRSQPRPQYGRGHATSIHHYDDQSYQVAPVVFTHEDVTIKRFTEAQVYTQAGMVIKANAGLRPTAKVFDSGEYDSQSKELSYTLKEMSDRVARLVATTTVRRSFYAG